MPFSQKDDSSPQRPRWVYKDGDLWEPLVLRVSGYEFGFHVDTLAQVHFKCIIL